MRFVLIAPAYIVKTWLQSVYYFRLLFALIWWKDDEKPQTNNSQSHKEEVLCVCLSPFTANLLIRHECDSSRLDSMQCEAVSFNHFNLFQFFVNIFIKIPWRCDWASLFIRILRYFAIENFWRKDKNSFNYVFSGA